VKEVGDRITVDPDVLVGKPTIRGLRISVEQILKALAAGVTTQGLLQDYPDLEEEDIKASLLYASQLVEEERVFSVGQKWRDPAADCKEACRKRNMGWGLKFLIDVGVGTSVDKWLRENGYDAVSVRDVDSRAKDQDILQLAVREGRMIITMDKDFGELVYNSGLAHSGVLILRLEDATSEEKVDVVKAILSEFAASIENKFCVYQNGKLRIRG
jgi:uncharacterized protein (DUF433 family)/predicted nuclease of predicted toxin-antitoxin system